MKKIPNKNANDCKSCAQDDTERFVLKLQLLRIYGNDKYSEPFGIWFRFVLFFLLWSHIKRIPRHKQLKSGTERIKNKWIKVKDILLNVWFREIIESIRIIHYYKLQILTHCEFEWIIPEHMLFVLLSEQKQCVDVWVNCIAFPTRKNHNKCEL